MEDAIRNAIEHQSRKLLKREEKKRFAKRKFQRRHRLRTGKPSQSGVYRAPAIWAVSPHFDPKYCIKHSKYLARVIWQKIRERAYAPESAIRYKIPKEDGTFREIMVFSIPDAAVANLFFKRLRDKNRNPFSPFSYAYMHDRGLFDAVIPLKSFFESGKKYVIQFDFAKYFDSIDHKYIEHIFENTNFNISETEKFLLGAFLRHPISDAKAYMPRSLERRQRGVPQGSSLSLFLANLAGHALDRRLEATNGQFVRFADDIVAVTSSHNDALSILNSFNDHCRYSGISINHQKSPGIAILASDIAANRREFFVHDGDGAPIAEISDFDYIGHKFTGEQIGLSTRGFRRTKRAMGKIIYLHLLYSLKNFADFDMKRVSGGHFDWDLVTCINEIRRFLYGSLKQKEIKKFLLENSRIGKMRGFIGFCPLMDSIEQFRALDGWLANVLQRALRERYRLIHERQIKSATDAGKSVAKIVKKKVPTKNSLLNGDWYDGPSKLELELSLPSAVLAWRAARKKYKQYGLDEFDDPKYYSIASQFPTIGTHYE